MATVMKPGWSKPSTILFATEIPANEKVFTLAISQAKEFDADLILFHSYDTLMVGTAEIADMRIYDSATVIGAEKHRLEPLVRRINDAGVRCEVVLRAGMPADQIVAFTREREVDRIIMGTHSPGPIGKLLVGSVAEAVLRTSRTPVYIVGPDAVDGSRRKYATRTILCAVSMQEASKVVVTFAAELAAQHNARLILQHVINPQQRTEILAGRTLDEVEMDLLALIPTKLRSRITIQTIVVPGDPTEELLYQSRTQQADLIVLGAHGASAFAAITRHGIVYKVLAHSHCPVATLSPAVLAECDSRIETMRPLEAYMAGNF